MNQSPFRGLICQKGDSSISHLSHGGRASFGQLEASQQAWIVARFPRVVMLGFKSF